MFAPIYAEKPNQLVALIRYPGREATGSDQGVGAHKDSDFLTVLLQDESGGSRVETESGWIDATRRPEARVVSVGELL